MKRIKSTTTEHHTLRSQRGRVCWEGARLVIILISKINIESGSPGSRICSGQGSSLRSRLVVDFRIVAKSVRPVMLQCYRSAI